MRLVAAHCSAIYTGRGDTKLGPGLRAIMIKEDGSVSIHNDVSNKPLNYMKTAAFTEEILGDKTIWTFDFRRESLRIEIDEIVSDIDVPLIGPEDEGLVRDGTENHLQKWISENIEVLGEGSIFLGREFPTGDGPVDLFIKDSNGIYVAVEVKRVATTVAVDQVRRYVEALASVGIPQEAPLPQEDDESPAEEHTEAQEGMYGEVAGMIAALDIRPKAAALAERRGIRLVTIPADWKNLEYIPQGAVKLPDDASD